MMRLLALRRAAFRTLHKVPRSIPSLVYSETPVTTKTARTRPYVPARGAKKMRRLAILGLVIGVACGSESASEPVSSLAEPLPLTSNLAPTTGANLVPSGSLIPKGYAYTDNVPDTLDLAERAELFLQGMTKTLTPPAIHATGKNYLLWNAFPSLSFGKLELGKDGARAHSGSKNERVRSV